MRSFGFHRLVTLAAAATFTLGAGIGTASADTVSGSVSFTGDVAFATPIAGISETDLTVSSGPAIEGTGNGEHCNFVTPASTGVALGGTYPDAGTFTVGISVTKNGNGQSPDGGCLVQLQANGNDGAGVSAHGTTTVEVTLADIQGSATVAAPTITLRQSKSIAGVDKYCLKYLKKQVKFRGKCNATLWKDGGTEGAEKCKFEPEPVGCDPADYVEATLALSFGDMDQQTDPPSALAVDLDTVGEQAKCQKYIGKAAANFFAKRNQLVQKKCVEPLADTAACRAQQTADARAKLSLIDNCIQTQAVDVMSGLTIANVDEPCLTQAFTGLSLDRKALKDCFELELSTYSDGAIGDVPICGNDVLQPGEACDDGNNANGDCCSSVCGFEPAGEQTCGIGACEVTVAACALGEPVTCTPNSPGVESGNCADNVDNDCDGLTDNADGDDCP